MWLTHILIVLKFQKWADILRTSLLIIFAIFQSMSVNFWQTNVEIKLKKLYRDNLDTDLYANSHNWEYNWKLILATLRKTLFPEFQCQHLESVWKIDKLRKMDLQRPARFSFSPHFRENRKKFFQNTYVLTKFWHLHFSSVIYHNLFTKHRRLK